VERGTNEEQGRAADCAPVLVRQVADDQKSPEQDRVLAAVQKLGWHEAQRSKGIGWSMGTLTELAGERFDLPDSATSRTGI
jgi:hypothetical protein